MRAIEVFTGAGGLALGIHRAGFEHVAFVENDGASCATLHVNRHVLGIDPKFSLEPTRVQSVDWRAMPPNIDLMSGGVPCQPFSLGGRHRGHEDERNLFPEMIRAVRETTPKAVIVENVKGLLRTAFRPYFEYVVRQLEEPEIKRAPREDWIAHDRRLQKEMKQRGARLTYHFEYRLLQAANFGVPQLRERVLLVGFRTDLDLRWDPPTSTHSMESLVYSQSVTGDYWAEHGLRHSNRAGPRLEPAAMLIPPVTSRWRTVRDAIAELPPPERRLSREHSEGADYCRACHWANPGARSYKGHQGSEMDWPAKTLKAGVHGVPGGENMIQHANGKRRYFTVREAARLQGFPDEYHFPGSWSVALRQLGNAVPVPVAAAIAAQVRAALTRRTAAPANGLAVSA